MATKNIFSELGFDDADATAETWRGDLTRILREYFRRSQMSQVAFANRLGIKQSVVSRIVNGRVAGLSIEFLLRLCVRLKTRGIATWGPSADEAQVTTELPTVLGTALSVSQARLNVADEVVEVSPQRAGRTARKLVASRTTLARMN